MFRKNASPCDWSEISCIPWVKSSTPQKGGRSVEHSARALVKDLGVRLKSKPLQEPNKLHEIFTQVQSQRSATINNAQEGVIGTSVFCQSSTLNTWVNTTNSRYIWNSNTAVQPSGKLWSWDVTHSIIFCCEPAVLHMETFQILANNSLLWGLTLWITHCDREFQRQTKWKQTVT